MNDSPARGARGTRRLVLGALLTLSAILTFSAFATAVSVCVISGTVLDGSGNPVANATVSIRTIAPALVGGYGIARNDIKTKTSATGTWSLTVTQGLAAQVDIPATGEAWDFTVPSTSTAAYSGLTLYARGTLTPATILSDHGPSMGGDLSGSSPNPTVVAIQGKAVSATAPTTTGQALLWNVSTAQYEPGVPAGTGVASITGGTGITVGGTATVPTVGITAGSVTNTQLGAGAAALNVGALSGALSGTLPSPALTAGIVDNAAVSNSAGIAWSKINKTGATAADVGATAASAGLTGITPGTGISVSGGAPTLTVGISAGGVGPTQLASGAAASNVGTVSGVLAGTLPSPTFAAGAIQNADINASAAIAWTKVSKSGAVPSDVGAEASANKGQLNGYAALDGTGKVPTGQLPATMAPSAHASSHATGQGDPVSPASIGASAVGHTHAETDVTSLSADLADKLSKASGGTVAGPTTFSGTATFSGAAIFSGSISSLANTKIPKTATATDSLTLRNSFDLQFQASVWNVGSGLPESRVAGFRLEPTGLNAGKLSFLGIAGDDVIGSEIGWFDLVTGAYHGALVGNVTGDTAGTHTGAVIGAVTGNTAGVHTGNVIGNVTGNADTATDGLSSASGTAPLTLTLAAKGLTGSVADATGAAKGIVQLAGDLGGTAASPSVASVGGQTAANVAAGAVLANAATASNTPSTILKRDGAGQVASTTFTGALVGNATTASDGLSSASGTAPLTLSLAAKALTGSVAAMGGATAGADGTAGLVTKPLAGDQNKVLRGDGTWGTVGAGTVTSVAIDSSMTGTNPITSTGTIGVAVPLPALAGASLKIPRVNVGETAIEYRSAAQTASDIGAVTTGTALVGDVTGTSGATVVSTVGGQSAANVAAGVVIANAATAANTAGAAMRRDGAGQVAATTFTGALAGNASTATTATNFSGSLVGDVTGTQGATVVSTVAASSAANVHAAELLANAATNANTASTIVKRDGSGNFSAGTITATLSGNATNVTGTVAVANGGTGDTTAAGARTNLGLGTMATQAASAVAVTGGTLAGLTTTTFAAVVDNGNSGAAKTIDWTLGNRQKITTTASCTLTFTAPSGPTNILLKIIHEASATAYTYTWPVAVKWPGGIAAVTTDTSGAVDIVSCFYDGSTYNCVANADFK